jgi:hypothetical protein
MLRLTSFILAGVLVPQVVAQTPAPVAPSNTTPGYIPVSELKNQWSLHPGPLMVDAHHWGWPKSAADEQERICEPDLNLVAQLESRRYVRVGRVDVFARINVSSAWRQAGNIGSLWDFVASRSTELAEGLDIRTLSTEERELMVNVSNGIPSVARRLMDGGEGVLTLFPALSWNLNGVQGGHYFVEPPAAQRTKYIPPTTKAPWMEPRPFHGSDEDSFDFGEGRLISITNIAAMLFAKQLVVRYDARLAESMLFLKGEFSTQELIESLAEVSNTVPFFVQDRRSIANHAKVRYVELTRQLLQKKGFPGHLLERIDDQGNLVATQQELLAVPEIRSKYGSAWGSKNETVTVESQIRLLLDTKDDWVTRSSLAGGMWMGAMGILSTGVKPG